MHKTLEDLEKKYEEEKRKSPMGQNNNSLIEMQRQMRTHTSVNLKFDSKAQSSIDTMGTNQKSQSFVDQDKDSKAIFRNNTQEFTSTEQSAPLSKERQKQQVELQDKKTAYADRVNKALGFIHSKIIKYDSKTGFVSFKPLKESNKIQDAMNKMDKDLLQILIKFLKTLAEDFAVFSIEMASQKNSIQQTQSGNLQVIIACCYAKIVLLLPEILDQGVSQAYFAKIQDGLTLLCDFFNYFVIVTPNQIRKDTLEIMLGFSLIATEVAFFSKKGILNKRFPDVTSNIEMRQKAPSPIKHDIGSIMFSILSLCAALVPVHLLHANPEIAEAYDEENQAFIIKILIQMIQLSSSYEEVFFGQIFFLRERHIIQKHVNVFRLFLEEPSLGIMYEETSLLNLLVQVLFRAMRCWKNKIPKRAPGTPIQESQKHPGSLNIKHIVDFEAFYKDLLIFLDKIHIMQVKFYLKTEGLTEAQIKQAQEAEKIRLFKDQEQKGSQMQEKPSRDKETEENKRDKITKHYSKDALSDKDIFINGSCKLQGDQLVAQLNYQENWIRVNMALFKIGALLQPNYFLHFGWQQEIGQGQSSKKQQEMKIQIYNKKDFLSHMCDLMRIHLYFIMRFDLYSSVYNRPLKKLRDINEFYIAYNCNLVQSIQIFSQLLCDSDNQQYNLHAQLQFQSFLMLLVDQSSVDKQLEQPGQRPQKPSVYAQVDKKQFLRIWYLIFSLVGPALPFEKTPQGGFKSYIFKGGVIDRSLYFDCLHSFIKDHFYREKNLKLYEETYDVEDFESIEALKEIISQQYQSIKAQEMEEGQRKSEALTQINKVIVQRLALQRLVDIAQTDSYIYERCWNVISSEIQSHKQKEKLQGNLFQDNTYEVIVNGQKQKVVERICSGSYMSKLYQYVKLAVYLLVSDPREYEFNKVYNILVANELTKNGENKVMTSSQNEMIGNKMNDPRSKTMPDNQGLAESEVDDCLMQYCPNFQTHPFFKLTSTRDMWAILIEWIKNMSQVLTEQANQGHRRGGGNQVKQSQTNSLLMSKSKDLKGGLGGSQPRGGENRSFEFLDKVNNLLKRFVVYATQSNVVCDQVAKDMQDAHRSAQAGQSDQLAPQFSAGNKTQLELITSNFKEVKDNEFKLLVLRNICFTLDPNTDEKGQNFEVIFAMLKFTLGSCKAKFDSLISQEKEYSKKFEQGKAEGAGVKHKVIELREKFFEKMLAEYRRQAYVAMSIIKIYTNDVCQEAVTLDLLEMQKFHQSVLKSLKMFVMAEGSYVKDLILESLNVYHFDIRESSDPFQIGPQIKEPAQQETLEFEEEKSQTNTQQKNNVSQESYQTKFMHYAFYKFWLDFVLESCLEYKNIAESQADTALDFYSPVLIKKFEKVQEIALLTVKEVIKSLREKLDYLDDVYNLDLLKFARSLPADSIKSIKKIFIYLREQQDSAFDRDSGEQCDVIISYLRKIMAKVLSYLPKASEFKEFFSFLREILFYNDQLDDVDQKLANDMLWTLNRVLGVGSEHLIDPKPLKQISQLKQQQNRMSDFFHFSRVSQGILLTNQFRLDYEPLICSMFKFEWSSMLKDAKANGGQLEMTLMSFVQHTDKDGNNIMNLDNQFNVKLVVNSEDNTFRIGNNNFVQQIQRGWQFIILRFRLKKEGINIFSEKVYYEILFGDLSKNNQKYTNKLEDFDPKGEYYFALGASVEHCLNFKQQQSQLSPYNFKQNDRDHRGLNPALQGDYFRGCMSLPLFLESVDSLTEFLKDQEVAGACSDALAELICQKKIINHNGLDLQPYIDERRKQMQKFGEQVSKNSTKYTNKKEIKTLDEFTTPVILIHSKAAQAGHLFAVHSVSPSKIFVTFGGFKNLLPLVEKVLKSNLRDLSVNRTKPGQILKWFFRILNTMLQTEPAHIEALQNQCELLAIIKNILIKLSKYNMLTQEVIYQLKNLFKENLLVRTYRMTSKDQDQEFQPGKADVCIFDIAGPQVQKKEKFIESFLARLLNDVLLDNEICMLTCFIQKGQTKGDSTTHSEAEMMAQPRTTTKFVCEIVDLLEEVCCATKNHRVQLQNMLNQQSRGPTSQFQQSFQPSINLSQAQTDYIKLQNILVKTEYKTVNRILNIIKENSSISQCFVKNLAQLADCTAYSILHLSDTAALSQIRKSIKDKNQAPELLKFYLLVLLKVMRGVTYQNKDQKPVKKFLNELEEVQQEHIVPMMTQFIEHERDTSELYNSESVQHKDQIIAISTLLIVQIAINKKSKFGKDKADLDGSDKLKLIKTIKENIDKNCFLMNNSYLTLMMLAFRRDSLTKKEGDVIPQLTEVLDFIKQKDGSKNDRNQQNTGNNWDIEFYFLVLRNLQLYSKETKKYFLTHVLAFLDKHVGQILAVFSRKHNNQTQEQEAKNFFYEIVETCLAQKDRALQELSIDVIVRVLSCLLTDNRSTQFRDRSTKVKANTLFEEDFHDMTVFFKIFEYFGSKGRETQFIVLKKTLAKVMEFLLADSRDQQRYKVNMKLIILLQFIEQMFLHRQKELCNVVSFLEMLTVFIFLLEHQKVLTFDMPDENRGIYSQIKKKVEKEKPTKNGLRPKTGGFRKAQEERDKQISLDNKHKSMSKIDREKKTQADIAVMHPYLASLTAKQHENTEIKDLRSSQRLDSISKAEKSAKGYKPQCWTSAPIFVSGGPIRTLFHIMMKNINNHSLEMPLFAMNIDLLRYLLFNEQSDRIQRIINQDLGDFPKVTLKNPLKFSSKEQQDRLNLRRDTKDSINDLSNMLMRQSTVERPEGQDNFNLFTKSHLIKKRWREAKTIKESQQDVDTIDETINHTQVLLKCMQQSVKLFTPEQAVRKVSEDQNSITQFADPALRKVQTELPKKQSKSKTSVNEEAFQSSNSVQKVPEASELMTINQNVIMIDNGMAPGFTMIDGMMLFMLIGEVFRVIQQTFEAVNLLPSMQQQFRQNKDQISAFVGDKQSQGSVEKSSDSQPSSASDDKQTESDMDIKMCLKKGNTFEKTRLLLELVGDAIKIQVNQQSDAQNFQGGELSPRSPKFPSRTSDNSAGTSEMSYFQGHSKINLPLNPKMRELFQDFIQCSIDNEEAQNNILMFFCDNKYTDTMAQSYQMMQSEDIPQYFGEDDEESKSQAPYVAQEIFSSMGLGGAPQIKIEKPSSSKRQAVEQKAKPEKEQTVLLTGDKLNEKSLVQDHFRRRSEMGKQDRTESKQSEVEELNTESELRSTGISVPKKKYGEAFELDKTSDSLVIEFYSNTDNSIDTPQTPGSAYTKEWIKPLQEMIQGQESHVPHFGKAAMVGSPKSQKQQSIDDQIRSFISLLHKQLMHLHDAVSTNEQLKIIKAILSQTILKQNQRTFMQAFATSTSSMFKSEMDFVAINAKKQFQILKKEISNLKKIHAKTKQIGRPAKKSIKVNMDLQGRRRSNTKEDSDDSEDNRRSDLLQSELIPASQMEHMDFDRSNLRRISSGQGVMQRPVQPPKQQFSPYKPPPMNRTMNQSNQSYNAPNSVTQSVPSFGLQNLLHPTSSGSPDRLDNFELSIGHSSAGPYIPEQSEYQKVTMLSLYAKKQYARIIKRLETDEGTFWFDNLEQEIQDFSDIQKFYNSSYIDELPKPQQKVWLFKNHRHFQQEVLTSMKDEPFFLAYQKNYGKIVENPKKRKTMVRQRRTIDSWGRMMLLKPDRKYLTSLAYKFYDNFVNDYIKKMFAVSLLHDEDFQDYNGPKQMESLKQSPSKFDPRTEPITTIREDREEDNSEDSSNQNRNSQQIDTTAVDFTQAQQTAFGRDAPSIEDGENTPKIGKGGLSPDRDFANFDLTQPKQKVHYSPSLQQIREELLNKMEKNRLLKRVLTDKSIGYKNPPFDQLEQSTVKEEQTYLENLKNKLRDKREHVMASLRDSDNAERIKSQMLTLAGPICGDIFVTSEFFVFYSTGLLLWDTSEKYSFEPKNASSRKKLIVIKWKEVEEVFRRKCMNRNQAFEVTTIEKKVLTFNFNLVEHCNHFIEILTTIKDENKYSFQLIKDPVETFKQRNHKDDWSIGVKSNQEFLLMINKFSSRSTNDWGQYPIFPWIIQDYKSTWSQFQKKKERGKTEIYRDLTTSLGAITEYKRQKANNRFNDRKDELKEIQDCIENDEPLPFPNPETEIYGHSAFQQKFGFSQKLHNLNFLMRMEPYATAYMFQNMKRENADRNFYNFDKLWSDIILVDPSCNQELVPEYFYMPEVFTNQNCMYHGIDNGNAEKGDIPTLTDQFIMPPWALNQFDLVRIMRESLESKYVTEHLGSWIDLVFGKHQASTEKLNLFCDIMYEKHHKAPEMQTEITDNQLQSIEEFYQVPVQLFTSEVVKEKVHLKSQVADRASTQVVAEPQTQVSQSQANRKDYKKQQLQGLILLFKDCGHDMQKRQLLQHIADHQKLNSETNIIHMILTISSQKCMVFLRDDMPQKSAIKETVYEKQHAKLSGRDVTGETGRIMLYLNKQNLQCKDFDRSKGFDLGMRYEHVADRIQHIFQEFYDKKHSEGSHYLYAGGYFDNSVRVFDFAKQNKDNYLVHKIYDHNARVTCIRFSEHYKYLYTCDEDGQINHYQCNCHLGDTNDKQQLADKESKEKKQAKNHKFPFDLIHTVHDQLMEIIAIDTNETLDMYCTLSHDGTIAVRCQRTSRLYQHFSIYAKNEGQVQETSKGRGTTQVGGKKGNEKQRALIDKFSKIFTKVHFLKLSLHGYIIVCGEGVRGQSITSRDRFLYLVFSLNGDLLRQKPEQSHVRIKNIFLSTTEDCLIVASNHVNKQKGIEYGNLEVVKLYGLERTTNLSPLVYSETINMLKQNDTRKMTTDKHMMHSKENVPTIQAISLARLERNMNIFFVKKNQGVQRVEKSENKEIICFDVSKNQVWEALQDFGF